MNSVLLAQNDVDIGVMTRVMLRRGENLYNIKQNETYRGQADTFNEYLAANDVRDDARKCIDLYKFYILEHSLLADDIQHVHYKRLLEIMPAVKKQPHRLFDWIEWANELSWKDLINKVREVKGRPPLPREGGAPPSNKQVAPMPLDSHCLVCGGYPVDKAHWPVTKAAGGRYTIPLCRECHADMHQYGIITWTDRYRKQLHDYFMKLKEGR